MECEELVDVLIVGAGLSGIGAAVHLSKHCPSKSFAIIEARSAIGGTWDLFQYPGIRSDSDMFTLGYCFKPWLAAKGIADGPAILNYINETAKENGIDKKVRLGQRAVRSVWSSADARWDVQVMKENGVCIHYSCSYLIMSTGYYNYAEGYTPEFAGLDRFKGIIVHPQKWPTNLDYSGKKVVIIGSGATAVTLVPSMAKSAEHVTMLQRSPTYIFPKPSEDPIAIALRHFLPAMLAYTIIRGWYIIQSMFFFWIARRKPAQAKKTIIKEAAKHLPKDFDVATHLTPSYDPWRQRVCLAPDADFFEAICNGTASIVTDKIDSFTRTGIKLESGTELSADIIITATGLKVQLLSGMEIVVDGARVDLTKAWIYKGMMYSGVPNLTSLFGYTNASWTLKCDLSCEYTCRLINFMDTNGYTKCVPERTAEELMCEGEVWADFSSGYIQRSFALMPRQGPRLPWKLKQNYAVDFAIMRLGGLVDGVMQFSGAGKVSPVPPMLPGGLCAALLAIVLFAILTYIFSALIAG